MIEKNIYKKGKSVIVDFSLEENEIRKGSQNYPLYLGQDFEFDGIDYKLYDDFLNEVFNECIGYFKNHKTPLIENHIEDLRRKAELNTNIDKVKAEF